MRRKIKGKIDWKKAPDIKRKVVELAKAIGFEAFVARNIYTYRSTNANTRAYARIWGLSYLWQKTLNIKPSYIIEVISEKFDRLSDHEKDEVLLHEIAHIPKNFSGALVPHKRHGAGNFHDKLHEMIKMYRNKK